MLPGEGGRRLRPMRAPLFALTLTLFSSSAAWASTKAGVTLPDKANVGGKDLVLNGLGVREATVFNVEVYVAGLYVEEKTGNSDAVLASDKTKKLTMHFVREVDQDDLVGAFEEGFEKNGAGASLAAKVKQFLGYLGAVNKGDEIVMSYVPEKGVEVAYKGAVKGTIAGADFQKVLYAIFVGPKPPNASLKQGLLGK